jgi:hypothetical protein
MRHVAAALAALTVCCAWADDAPLARILITHYILPLSRIFGGREWGTFKFSIDATHNSLLAESVTGFDYTAYQGTISEPSWVSRLDVRYAIQHLRILYSIYHLPTALIGPGANMTNSPVPYNVKSNSVQSISAEYDFHQVTFRAGSQDIGDSLPSFPSTCENLLMRALVFELARIDS